MKAKTNKNEIPHEQDIWTAEQLHAGLATLPMISCYWEADCLMSAHQPDKETPDMISWQAHWWDAIIYNLGYAVTQLLRDISVPNLWNSHFARQGSSHAMDAVKEAAIESFIAHDGHYMYSLGCFMGRIYQDCKTMEMQYGYPRNILAAVAQGASHHEQAQKHLDKCLS